MPQSMFTEVFVLDSTDRAAAGMPDYGARPAEAHAGAVAHDTPERTAADSVFSVRIHPQCAMRFVKGGSAALHKALSLLLGPVGDDRYRTQIEHVLMNQVEVLQDCPSLEVDDNEAGFAGGGAHHGNAVRAASNAAGAGVAGTRNITMTPFNDADGALAGVVVCTRTKSGDAESAGSAARERAVNVEGGAGSGIESDVSRNANITTSEKTNVEKGEDEKIVDEYPGKTASPELLKQQLLAVISHELRSPLAGIRSWSHVLEQALKTQAPAALSLPVQRAIQGVVAGVDRQVAVVDCLIDAARVLTGDIKLRHAEFSLSRAVDTALAKVAGEISERRLSVDRADIKHFNGLPNIDTVGIVCVEPDDWQNVSGDFDRIAQAVQHLLLNAVKFSSEAATIRITMEGYAREAGPPASNGVRLSIENSGQAIPQAALTRIFAPFDQADQSTHRQHDGLGLGLSVARRLIELHGGTISAENLPTKAGGGVRFSLVLPQASPVKQLAADGHDAVSNARRDESAAAKFACLTGLSVMVVDDQEEARESLTAMLEQSGASVVPMASGLQAVSQLEADGASCEPDVLICDIAMPGQDGYTTLRCIRAWEAESGLVPGTRMAAIALTAFAQEEDRQRAFASGYEAHFAKPVDPAQLLVAIANLAEKAV